MKRKYLPASHIIKAYYTPYIRMPTFNKKGQMGCGSEYRVLKRENKNGQKISQKVLYPLAIKKTQIKPF